MKLKITNKWTAEVIELEGTEAELAYFMSNYKPQYNYYPWFNSTALTGSGVCFHDYDLNSTAPACKKCGCIMPTLQMYPYITYGDSPYNTTGFITTASCTD